VRAAARAHAWVTAQLALLLSRISFHAASAAVPLPPPCTPRTLLLAGLYWYASINLGSIWSYTVTPLIRAHAGFPAAFLTSFGALGLSLLVFLVPARAYVYVPPSGASVYATIVRVLAAATGRGGGGSGGGSYRTEHTPLIGRPGGAASSAARSDGSDGGDSGSSAVSGFTPIALGAPAVAGVSAGAGLLLPAHNAVGGGYNTGPVVRLAAISSRAAAGGGNDPPGAPSGGHDGSGGISSGGGGATDEGHPTIMVDSDVGSSVGSRSGAGSLDDSGSSAAAARREHGSDDGAGGGDDADGDATAILRDTSFSKGGKLTAFARRSSRWAAAGGGGGSSRGGAVCCGAIRLDRARGAVPDGDIAGVAALLGLVPLFGCLPMFWALFDAQDSLWTLQRRHMNLCLGADSGAGWCLTTEQLGVLNPVLVLLFVPLMDKVILPALTATRRLWLQPTPLRRMTVGMQLAAASFVLTALVQSRLDSAPEGTVPVLLQAPQFIVMAAAEMLVSATGLEFAYSQAPPSMRGSIMALFFLMTFVGDSLNGALYGTLTAVLSPLQMLLLLAALMSASGLVFALLAWRYRPVDASVWGASATGPGGATAAGGTLSLAAEHGDGDARDGPGGSTAPSTVI
jgi:hypothetical protein